MAELGSINHTDVNRGTSAIDRRDELRAVGNALDVTKKVIDEGVIAVATNRFNAAIADTGEDVSPIVAPDEPQRWPAGSREADLQKRVDELTLQARNGTSSQRTLAEMRLQFAMVEAQRNFPWLEADLARRAGRVQSTSEELIRLGLQDAALEAGAEEAADRINKIYAHATASASGPAGGLGIDPSLSITDPRFIAQFTARQEAKDAIELNNIRTALALADTATSAAEKLPTVLAAFQGPINLARTTMEGVMYDQNLYNAVAELQKGGAGDVTVIDHFKTTGITLALQKLSELEVNLGKVKADMIDPALAGTKEMEPAERMMADVLAEIQALKQNFTDAAANIPGAAARIESIMAMRSYSYGQNAGLPFQQAQAFYTAPGVPALMDLMASGHTVAGLISTENFALMANDLLGAGPHAVFGSNPSAGQRLTLWHATSSSLGVSANDSPEEVQRKIDVRLRTSDSPLMVKVVSQEDEAVLALKTFDNAYAIWNTQLSNFDPMGSPNIAANILTSMNTSISTLKDHTLKAKEVQDEFFAGLASSQVGAALEATATQHASQRIAFGNAAQEWYVNQNPLKRRQEAKAKYDTTRVGGISLADLVGINVDSLNGPDAAFDYEIDAARVTQIAKARQQQFAIYSKTIPQIERDVRQEIEKAWQPILQEMVQQVSIEMNLNKATAYNFDQARRSNVLLEFYLGSESDPLPWADIFKPVLKSN